ncbi:MAG: hypothetical protein IKL79_01725 [Clostridia bacterium]|nr:hypothetical protein [Clostridia bacterium]
MRNKLLRSLSLLLVVSLLVTAFAVVAGASTSSTGYAETADWLNTNPAAPTDYAYSLAIVGDTQSIVKKDLTNGTNYMASIYSWLADNADEKNIQYVLGVGDITEYTENFDSSFDGSWEYADEWTHAKAAITLLDNKIPYSLCRGGGHDTVAKFNEYFGSHEYFTGNVDGTYAAGNYTSAYYTFEVGTVGYLILTLDWNPSDAILAWAEDIVKANPDRRIILTTHAYLDADGTLHGSSDSHTSVPETNNGVDIYEKLVSRYDNIQLVLSGHNPSANLVYRQDARESGSVVTSLLVDPQTFDSQNNAETGMVCMLYFSEDGEQMTAEWYSTVRDQYYRRSNQFSLNLAEMPDEEGNILTKYGTIPAKYADADTYPFLAFQGGEFLDLGDVTYDFFIDATGCMGRKLRNYTTGGEITVVARKSFKVSSEGYAYTNYWSLPVTLDLCGYTVDASEASKLFAVNATKEFNTSLTVKNGTIKNLKNALITISTGGDEKTQGFRFEDLNIISNYKELVIFNKYSKKGDIFLDFVNCDITFLETSSFAGNVFRAGNSGDTNGLMHTVCTVMGGSVTLPTSDNFDKFVQEYNGSTVTFLPDDKGNMTKVIIPIGTTVSATAYRGENGDLYLVKSNAGDTTAEYVIASLETPYGTIPYDLSSLVEYPFIAFVGNEIIGSANAFIDESGCLERALRNKNTGGGATIILRRDFILPKQGFLYTNYQKGVFTVDLMGYTVTNPFEENLFSSNGTQTHESTTIVKNGTLKLTKGLWSVSTHSSAPGKIQNITFENLDITVGWSHLAFHNNASYEGKVNINYVNCNIASDNLVSGIFQAGKSATNMNIKTHVTVTGGSLKIPTFNQETFTVEHHGSVAFLPDEDGEYIRIYAKTVKNNALDNAYTTDNGDKTLVKFGTDGGYGVYLLRVADKLVAPKASLTMHSSFVYNIYVPVKDFITAITLDGVPYDTGALVIKVIDNVEYWHIEKQIGVNEAGGELTLVIESDVQKQQWSLGVIAYASALINGSSYNETEKALARDILAYVSAAYVYESNEDTSSVKAQIDAIIGEDYAVNPDTSDEVKESTDGILAAGLVLGSRPAFYVIPEYEAEKYSFSMNGASVVTEIAEVDGKTAILIYTYAYAITETITYTVDGTETAGEYNLAAYLAFAKGEGSNENLVALVKALWKYSDSAKTYRAEATK